MFTKSNRPHFTRKASRFFGVAAVMTLAVPVPAYSADAPSATPANCTISRVLRVGQRSSQVECLERTLKAMGLQSVYINDYFGSSTGSTIRRYQAQHGLAVDGVVGPQTGRSLGIWSATATPAPKPAASSAPAAVASGSGASCTITRTLRVGSRGSAVACLERTLKAMGLQSVHINDYFGSSTGSTIRRYQAQHGLTVDGIVGPQTLRSLGLYGKGTTSSSTSSTSATKGSKSTSSSTTTSSSSGTAATSSGPASPDIRSMRQLSIPSLGMTRSIADFASASASAVQAQIDRCVGATLIMVHPGDSRSGYAHLAAHNRMCNGQGFGGVESLPNGAVIEIKFANGKIEKYRKTGRITATVGSPIPSLSGAVVLQTSKSSTVVYLVTFDPA